jgi:hypothetical protein
MKKILILTLIIATASSSYCQESENDFAEYGVRVALSPFGLTLSSSYNKTKKTAFIVSVGGIPESKSLITPKIENFNELEMISESTWMGFFVHHRPFEKQDWVRINFGLAIGYIEHSLNDGTMGGDYKVMYKNPPSGYLGIGFGQSPNKGIVFGADFGLLFGSGPEITGPDITPATIEKIENIKNSPVGSVVLPNFQFSIGYNF